MECTPEMQSYFDSLTKSCFDCHELAESCRKKGYDPEQHVEVSLAKNMAERVVGIIGVVAPQIKNSGADKRILELENEYGVLDWRVALKIAEEVAEEKFCTFKDKKEAMEVGIRTGFAYVTVGVVSSPLEGFVTLELKDRRDKKGQYFALHFSGPIRNAGGTAASVCVIIADYIRVKFGYAEYDPDEKEQMRCHREISDYHEYVTNLQYFPSEEESMYMVKHLPIEIAGDPSEKYEVSNFKDLPRIPTNRLRSGYCLIHSSCIPLKAPKLWKPLSKWGEEFSLGHWNFLEEFLAIQKKAKAKGKTAETKITPDYTYIKDLVAGRPVLGHPLANGAFRLRYGRSRVSGYSGQSIHPATMHVLEDFIAIGTQLKVERPGKATSITTCTTIDGPIVKLKDGSVRMLQTEKEAKEVKKEVEEVIYLGDVLINYGDFFDRAHVLAPPGYVQEYWALQLEQVLLAQFGTYDEEKAADLLTISAADVNLLLQKPLTTKLSFAAAQTISEKTKIPLHPLYTFYWNSITPKELLPFMQWLGTGSLHNEKLVIPIGEPKRSLEILGVEHTVAQKENVVCRGEFVKALLASLGAKDPTSCIIQSRKAEAFLVDHPEAKTLDVVNHLALFSIKDKLGVFIGSRMGRPEKAKMRKLTGNPHVLFPVGDQGGRMRSFQAALETGHIKGDFPIYYCEKCKKETIFSVCEVCDKKTIKQLYSITKGVITEGDPEHDPDVRTYRSHKIDINHYFQQALKKLKLQIYPDLIKGVRGTSNKDHIPEHLTKGILRSKHEIFVNKDGTTRYDATELVVTHFKPKEIQVTPEKLVSLGYTHDIKGNPLVKDTQILEIKPQDVILPCCPDAADEPADKVLFKTANFIDDMMKSLYGQKPFYNLTSKEDLVGHLVVGLAPHTSAGILARIIGFTKSQGLLAHPYLHAAMRRDVDGDESCILLLMDAFLNFSNHYLPAHRGSTMDAPLVLTYILNPSEVDDMAFHVDIVWKYPLEFYKAAEEYKMPWDVKIKLVNDVLGTPLQYEKMGYTHDTDDFNQGVLCSQYKLLPTMQEKLTGQMAIAKKVRAADEDDVARLVIEKHFLRDIKGNLRKFSIQQFRCVECNEKFRRPPLSGKCIACSGKIIFTISEGSVLKYLEPSINIANHFNVPIYLKQTLELTKRRIESYFGKDPERQESLGHWFS